MTSNKKLEDLHQAVDELKSLNKLALTISSTTDVDGIIKTIIQEATTLTGASQGSILLTTEESEPKFTTLIRKGTKKHESAVQKICMVIAGWILKHRETLMVDNVSNDARFEGMRILGHPIRSVLAAPIQAGGKTLGVLVLHSKKNEKYFKESDLRLVNIIASQSAHVLENAEMLKRLKEENAHLKKEVARKFQFDEIIGNSPAMQKLFGLLDKVIPTDARILIQGESGTGKELIARAIHYNGPRKKGRFVTIDCGALPENLLESELFGHVRGAFTGATESKKGLFHVADGGTLFLDEINNTSPALQAKLLRAIQEGEIRPVGGTKTIKVNVRVLCASGKNLSEAVERGTFRQDLFFRLNVVTVKLPPLRERKEDIPLLANHFLNKFKRILSKNLKGFTKAASKILLHHDWPGNVRELENAIERCATLAEPKMTLVDTDLLPDEMLVRVEESYTLKISPANNLPQAVKELERQMIVDALSKFNGNRSKASDSLGLSRRGLLNKIERYHLRDQPL